MSSVDQLGGLVPEEIKLIWITAWTTARMPTMAGIINDQKCTFAIVFIDESGEMSVNLGLCSLIFLYTLLYHEEIVQILKYVPKFIDLVDTQLLNCSKDKTGFTSGWVRRSVSSQESINTTVFK